MCDLLVNVNLMSKWTHNTKRLSQNEQERQILLYDEKLQGIIGTLESVEFQKNFIIQLDNIKGILSKKKVNKECSGNLVLLRKCNVDNAYPRNKRLNYYETDSLKELE